MVAALFRLLLVPGRPLACFVVLALSWGAAIPTSWPRVPTFDPQSQRIAEAAPAFAGYSLRAGVLVVAVAGSDRQAWQQAVQALFSERGEELQRAGHTPQKVQLQHLRPLVDDDGIRAALRDVPGATGVYADDVRQQMVVGLLHREFLLAAEAAVLALGAAPGTIRIEVPPDLGLNIGAALPGVIQARLEVPPSVPQGTPLPLRLLLTTAHDQSLEFGSCGPQIEIVDARTGQVVLPVPWGGSCAGVGLSASLSAGQEGEVLRQTLALRRLTGAALPPGDYLLRTTLEVDNRLFITPPPAPFTITPPDPDPGTAGVLAVLTSQTASISFRASLGTESGRPVVHVTVPDVWARLALDAALHRAGVGRQSVRYRVQSPTMPPFGMAGTARLTMVPGQNRFEFSADLSALAQRRPIRCEVVFAVLETVSGRTAARLPGVARPGIHPCPGKSPFQLTRQVDWSGKASDGRDAGVGTFLVVAGVRVTLPSGEIVWVTAPPLDFSR